MSDFSVGQKVYYINIWRKQCDRRQKDFQELGSEVCSICDKMANEICEDMKELEQLKKNGKKLVFN